MRGLPLKHGKNEAETEWKRVDHDLLTISLGASSGRPNFRSADTRVV